MAATYTVVKGDTLSEIARRFRVQYNLGSTIAEATNKLAKINDIPNPNQIVVGQVIKLQDTVTTSTSTSSASSSAKKVNSNQADVHIFGIQSNTDRTLFAAWRWSKEHTDSYQVKWTYDTGDGVWFVGNDGSEKYAQSQYSAPENALQVRFQVKPISGTHEVNDKEVSYWNASWSTIKTFDFRKSSLPSTPPTPTVEIEGYKLTATLDNLDVNTDTIQFKIIQNDTKQLDFGNTKIYNGHASYSCTVSAGCRYKVACRSVKWWKEYSEWSAYSDNKNTPPSTPTGLTIKATSETSVLLNWSKVENADTYSIEYATKKEYFDGSDQVQKIDSIDTLQYTKTGLESGEEYFFRIKAVNDAGSSGWSEINSIIIGKAPSPPTTWSSTTTATVGDTLKLYWVHNSEDNSSETKGKIELYINGEKQPEIEVAKSTDEDKKDLTSVYLLDTSSYTEGTTIYWRVSTAGITGVYGDWSVQRIIYVYAPPTLSVNITDSEGVSIDTIRSFPFYINGIFGPSMQTPIGFSISITALSSYETIDHLGNIKMVNDGEEIYSNNIDGIYPKNENGELYLMLSANSISLENNITYKVTCSVTMDTGLTTTNVNTFLVAWKDDLYLPNAEIGINQDTLTASIRPYCIAYPTRYYVVTHESGSTKYIKTSEEMTEEVEGISVDGAYTTTNEAVYAYLKSDGSTGYFCVVTNNVGELVEDVLLSVYRREYDGTFTEIATELKNINNTYVTDPHPALDYARYRIVAMSSKTGAVSYYDVPGYPVGEKAIIIQWNETWSIFDATESNELVNPPWSGSMLKLPYNIDTSSKYSPDVQSVNYIGRKHPVSYYGTHIGESASWNVDIPADDIDTLYALRRLAIWMGDVYVREPSGSGYWANINVSFKQTHRTVVIPVTLDITRVEGGV